jgi:GcrA cell cycle regulator
MTTVKDSPWTPQLKERFRELYEAGRTHSEIAAELGVTKNASVRQSRTLNLPPRKSGTSRRSAKRKGNVVVDLPSLGALVPATIPGWTTALRGDGPVKFLDLQHWHCRWPASRGEDGQFVYCGDRKIEGSPYCQHHHSRAYVNSPRPR